MNGVIDLLLQWGPIMFLPVTPFSAYLLSVPVIGLHHTVKLAATLVFAGSLIRCIPSFLECLDIGYAVSSDLWTCLIFLHIGNILDAIAGPLVMSPPPKLSAIWFPQRQRALATGIGVSAGVFGGCVGFLVGPFIHSVPILLLTDLTLCAVPFVCVWLYLPKHPSVLPSQSAKNALLSTSLAAVGKQRALLGGSNIQNACSHSTTPFAAHLRHFVGELKAMATNCSALIVALISGFTAGMFAGFSGVFQDMLSPLGISDRYDCISQRSFSRGFHFRSAM